MSTRSIIAEPHEDGWRGRYCHWDGYPEAKLGELAQLVKRDGVEKVRTVLLHDNLSWSSIDPNAQQENILDNSGRFRFIAGYGFARTDEEADMEMFTQNDKEFAWAEHLYILGDGMLFHATAEGDGWSDLTAHSYLALNYLERYPSTPIALGLS